MKVYTSSRIIVVITATLITQHVRAYNKVGENITTSLLVNATNTSSNIMELGQLNRNETGDTNVESSAGGDITMFSVDSQMLNDAFPPRKLNSDRICRNNDYWFSAGGASMNQYNCNSIRSLTDSSLRNRVCQLDHVQKNCPVSCGICCEDDPDYMFKIQNGKMKECSWLSKHEVMKKERRDRYCDTAYKGVTVRTACPKSCDDCMLVEQQQSTPPRRSEEKRPNLVMVMTDEHNLRTLSCYRNYLLSKFDKEQVDVWGDFYLETPNIDSLAEGGALYTNFYTATPLCTPSRASWFSGMYPPFAGTTTMNDGVMDDNVTTWAEILRDNGYVTSYIGKFHLDGTAKPGWEAPEGREFGFDDNRYRFNRGHWKYFDFNSDGIVQEYGSTESSQFAGREVTTYATDFLMDRGLEFIENSVVGEKPFAVVMSLPDPHGPNKVRPPFDEMFNNLKFKVPETGRKNMQFQPASPRFSTRAFNRTFVTSFDEYISNFESGSYQSYMQKYYGMVKCIDHNIGKLIQTLKTLGIEDNTVVVFTSDHGDMLMEHGRRNKGSPYISSAGIPFIIRYPQKIQVGKIIETAYSSIDFAPTILSLMGIGNAPSGTFQGVDGSSELLSSESISRDEGKIIFSFNAGNAPNWAAAIKDGYKLVISRNDTPWLFDMNRDHDELINYATSEWHQPIFAQLRDALTGAMIKFQAPLLEQTSVLYLDVPVCLDLDDIVHLNSRRNSSTRRNKRLTIFCDDIGVRISKGRCMGYEQVRQQCPVNCGTCCMDSHGKMLVDSQVKGCSSLSMYCENNLVTAFCPQTCNVCGHQ